MLTCSRNVLDEVGQEVHGVRPTLAGAVGLLVVHLPGSFHIGQSLEG
jgi:hypothetical protein